MRRRHGDPYVARDVRLPVHSTGHVVLLLVLFALCLAQMVIAVVDEYHWIYFAVGITIPPVACLFILIRMYIQPLKSFIYNIYITLIIELVAYVIHIGLKSTALVVLFISVWRGNEVVLVACTVLELELDTLLESKLLHTMAQLIDGTPAEINRTLREFRGRRGGAGCTAGSGIVPNGQDANGHIANEDVPNGLVVNGQIANGHVPNGQDANGHIANGNNSNGQVANGQVTNGFAETSL